MEKHVAECTPVHLQGELVLKLAQMMQFRDEILENERYILRDLCKMVIKGNRIFIDPIRRLTNQI